MNKFSKMFKGNKYAKMTCFILFNALCLYILFFIVMKFPAFADVVGKFFGTIFGAAQPLIVGLVIAYILSPLVNFVERKIVSKLIKNTEDPIKREKRFRRQEIISIILALLIVFLALAFLLYSFAALIFGQISLKGIGETMAALSTGAVDYQQAIEDSLNIKVPEIFSDEISAIIDDITAWISDSVSVGGLVEDVVAIGGSIVNFVIGLIFAIYLLIDKKFFIGLWNKFITLASPKKHEMINGTLSEVHVVLTSFIKGACVDSLIVAILSSLALKILGVEGAVVIGIFAGMANLIPYFGPILGMIPAFFMGLLTDGFWMGAVAVVLLFIIQQVDANIIYPKVVGKETGLRPLFVLFSITFLGYFGGIIGMLIAVPTAGVVQVFVLKIVKRREKKLQIRAEEILNEDKPEAKVKSASAKVPVSDDDSNKGKSKKNSKKKVD